MKDVFENFAKSNTWNNAESKSGPGSTLDYTVNLRHQLPVFCTAHKIETFFDAPCGDFNWMRAVEFSTPVSYIGGDISSYLVEQVRKEYASAGRNFIEFDITRDRFPKADVWFCRDCLFHLPFKDILGALINFSSAEIPYLFMTNHINSKGFKNTDVKPGGFRLLDFYSEPFNLPRETSFRVADYIFPHPQREMCVWTRQQVAAAIPQMYYKIPTA